MVVITQDIKAKVEGFANFAQLTNDVDIQKVDYYTLIKIYESLAWSFEKNFAERKKKLVEVVEDVKKCYKD